MRSEARVMASSDSNSETDAPALEARGLSKRYGSRHGQARGAVSAVDKLDLSLYRGKVAALVGQSGSGKSTSARLLALLERPDTGEILLDGVAAGRKATRAYRHAVQIILQDPFASLNPVHTIAYHFSRPLVLHGWARSRADIRSASIELLEQVSLIPGADYLTKLPHELSGGQRQRVSIALALAVRPRILLADEPVSMLDVSIRLGVLKLLRDLVAARDLALLYVTHDIASARYFADTIAVMYAGTILERGPAREVVEHPVHPYTRLLVAASPRGGRGDAAGAAGSAPLPQRPAGNRQVGVASSGGCPFASRCPLAEARCLTSPPIEVLVGAGHTSACLLSDPV